MRRGQHGLGLTFWLWFAAPQALVRGGLLLAQPVLALSNDGARLLMVLDVAVAVLSLIWFWFTAPGVWRAHASGFWSAAASLALRRRSPAKWTICGTEVMACPMPPI